MKIIIPLLLYCYSLLLYSCGCKRNNIELDSLIEFDDEFDDL